MLRCISGEGLIPVIGEMAVTSQAPNSSDYDFDAGARGTAIMFAMGGPSKGKPLK
jgi:hypothetical protein